MPSFPVVDTHVHLWDTDRFAYPWLQGAPAELNRPRLHADYRAATASVPLAGWVFEEAAIADDQVDDEVDWVAALSPDDPELVGIVAQVVLERGEELTDDLAHLATHPLVRGVRRIIEFQPDPEYCLRADHIAGVRLLAQHDLTCDLGTDRTRLDQILAFVRQVPEVTFVLNHLGKPGIADDEWTPWERQIRDFAALPNVTCKVSGLLTETGAAPFDRAHRYIGHVVEQFGFDRLMYGSDWPVQDLAGGLVRQVELLDDAFTGASEHELGRFWAGTAREIYRLPAPTLTTAAAADAPAPLAPQETR